MYVYHNKMKYEDDLYKLYDLLGWAEHLKVNSKTLNKAMENSTYVIYVYDNNCLVATGRVISDGLINGYICGIGVHPCYQNKGIGKTILKKLVNHCKEKKLNIQLICEEKLKDYYHSLGFSKFAIAMGTE